MFSTRRRRRISLVAAGLALSLVAAACGNDDDAATDTDDTAAAPTDGGDGGDQAAGEGSVWVLLPDSATSDRWESDDRRFFTAAFEEAGLSEGADFTIVNAEGDINTQQSQAEQAIADGASVIILVSLDPGSGATIIDQAQSEGVAVVEYDRFNPGGAGGDAYVSSDVVQIGREMAEVLEPEIDALEVEDGVPNVVMLNGGEEDNNSFLLRDGYAETVEARVEAGDWELVADQFVPAWDNQEAQTMMEQILVDANNDVDAVFVANDGMANSVINALEAAGLDSEAIPIGGQDATTAGIQNVLLGKQTVSVYKPIEAEATVAAEVALALRAGEDPTGIESEFEFELIGIDIESGEPLDEPGDVPYFATPPIGVTPDNVEDTVIADGFRTVEEICGGETAQTDFCRQNG